MRLINIYSLASEEHVSPIPPYAILSHRWEDDEVTFQEYQSISGSERGDGNDVRSKAGYQKIAAFCKKVRDTSLQFAWVDTCCIDKTSSAELSEAINSMYKWYKDASACYVYLSDVEPDGKGRAFHASQWFTRGWTLQELIAPYRLRFYARDWSFIGLKNGLADKIGLITGIDTELLRHNRTLSSYSVACRMSWASKRVTTREEDLAYCLMGIFGVNMPMLYGEGGERAFIRLQEELLKSSNDHSIFAWRQSGAEFDLEESVTGLLAWTPMLFENSADYEPVVGVRPDSLLVTLSNNGLSLNMPIIDSKDGMKAILNCCRRSQPHLRPCVRLTCRRVQESQFNRLDPRFLEDTGGDAQRQQIYVPQMKKFGTPGPEYFLKQYIRVQLAQGPYIQKREAGSFWISPHSYSLGTCRDAQPTTTGQHWTRGTPVYDAKAAPHRHWARTAELEESILALPQFIDTPALLFWTSDGVYLIGRAYDGTIGIQESPEGLLEALEHERPILDGSFRFLLEPFPWLDERQNLVRRDGSVVGITITQSQHELDDLFTIVLQPAAVAAKK